MAGAFWLSKVVVVLALLLRINCHAYTDDLLDRVRSSKSNEPEVRDFLRSVLQHRNDFRWIQRATNKVNMNAEALQPPLRNNLDTRAAATKNKRSFYLSERQRQRQRQQLEPSGYPANYDAVYGDPGGELDERRKNERDVQHTRSYHQHRHHHNRQHLQQQQDNYADDVDFDGPVNDLYPYQDDINAAQVPDDQQQRIARESPPETNVMYDDVQQHRADNENDDFLDDFVAGSETDAKPDPILNINEELNFVSDADDFNYDTDANENKRSRPKWFKRASSAEELLNEKLMLHSLLRKTAAENNNNNNNNNKDTNSDTGFQTKNVFKYEGGKGRRMLMNLPLPGNPIEVIPNGEKGVRFAPGLKYEKIGEMAKSDLESEPFDGPTQRIVKRKCTDSLQEHDFSVPELFSNVTQSKEYESPLAEFYFSQPHDVLEISQDLQSELRQTSNNSRNKRALRWEDFKRGRSDSSKKQKSINIKIFDDSQLVKDVMKGNGQNSIVLTIKNEHHSPAVAIDSTSTDSPPIVKKYLNDLQSNFLLHRDDDNTLQKIDKILKHDEESLKRDSYLGKKGVTAGAALAVRSVNPKAQIMISNNNRQLLFSTNTPKCIRYVSSAIKQNRLEDQTEPTSAAEQRELGKLNNRPNTLPGNMLSTSEKTFIIPLRKNNDNWIENFDRHQIDLIRSPDDRDMAIRVMIDNKLKDSEDVLGKLRKELEQSLMRTLTNEDLRKSRELLANMQKFRSVIIDNKKKKRAIEADQDCINNGIRGADAFRSRKLFEFKGTTNDEDERIVEGPDHDIKVHSEFSELADQSDNRQMIVEQNENFEKLTEPSEAKRDIRKILGMHRDEDYSEDRTDIYKTKKVRRAKTSKPSKPATHTVRVRSTTLPPRIMKSQQERAALKLRLARTRPIKVKKDLNSENDEADQILEKIDHAEQKHKEKSFKNEPVIPNEDENDKLNKRENDQELFLMGTTDTNEEMKDDSTKFTVVTVHGERTADRCCENDSDGKSNNKQGACNSHKAETLSDGNNENKDEEHFRYNENGDAENSNNVGIQSNGNELDIIEKTQAILLHLTATTPPVNEGRGDIDENDDPSLKRTGENGDNIVVKHINTYKVTDDEQKPSDDMVSQIMELVQNYKNKIEQSKQANKGVPPSEQNRQMAILDKKIKTYPIGNQNQKGNRDDLTPSADNREYSFTATQTNFADDETDNALHGHRLEHGKKLHPKSEKKCEMAEGIEKNEKCPKFIDRNQEEFILPIAVKEGYIKPEVVADIISDDRQSSVTEDPRERIFKQTNKRDIRNQENPLKFTPDSIDSFKEVVEVRKTNIENEDAGVDLVQRERPSEQRYKRNIDNNQYSEDEIEKLLEVNDADDLDKRRYRRYNYRSKSHYYEPFRRFPKQVTEARKIDKKKTKEENGGPPVIVKARTCAHDIDTYNRPTTASHSLSRNKKQHKTHDTRGLEDMNDNPSCAKKQQDTDASYTDPKLRDKNREKIYEQTMLEKRMEQERIKDVLNGHLMLSLMETFQTVLKHHARVQARFGHKMPNKCITEEVHLVQQNRDDTAKADVRHAQLMLHQVIVMLNKIVAEQVHRRTCMTLSPTLRSYLKRITNMKKTTLKSKAVAEGYPLPPMKTGSDRETGMNEKQGDFLFTSDHDTVQTQSKSDIEAALRRKIGMIRMLLKKYDHMSHNCQVKVDSVRDYLLQNLHKLQQMYKSKHFMTDDACGVACMQAATPNPGSANETTTIKPKEGESTKSENQSGGTSESGGTTGSGGSSETSSESTVSGSSSAETTASATESGASTTGSTATSKAVRSIYDDTGTYNNEASMFGSNEFLPYKVEKQSKSISDSEKYKKLVDAAATYRRKRQIEQRLARLFGHGKYVTDQTTQRSDNFDVEELNNIAYEAPLIYAMH